MLSELQQKKVWEAWLSAEIRANYFADLAGRYHRRQNVATWLILFFSSGTFGTIVGGLRPPWDWVAPTLALLTVGLSFYSLIAQNQKSAMDSADLHMRWNRLAKEYATLWDNMYAEDAPAQLRKLDEIASELSKSGTAFPVSKKRLVKWQDYVVSHHRLDVVHPSA